MYTMALVVKTSQRDYTEECLVKTRSLSVACIKRHFHCVGFPYLVAVRVSVICIAQNEPWFLNLESWIFDVRTLQYHN